VGRRGGSFGFAGLDDGLVGDALDALAIDDAFGRWRRITRRIWRARPDTEILDGLGRRLLPASFSCSVRRFSLL
jgi:hypothetical protein